MYPIFQLLLVYRAFKHFHYFAWDYTMFAYSQETPETLRFVAKLELEVQLKLPQR